MGEPELFAMEGGEDIAAADMDKYMVGEADEGIPFDDPTPQDETIAAVKEPIDHAPRAEEASKVSEAQDASKQIPTDPIISKLAEAISKLSPEQKSQLVQPSPIEITHNGQKISIPVDKQVPLIQQGLDYSAKMRALNVERQEFQAKQSDIDRKDKYYGEIDRVAKANPEWWNHVIQSYKNFSGTPGTGSADPNSPEMTPALRAALNRLDSLEQKLLKVDETEQVKQVQTEDAHLEQQIQNVAKEYADYDWLTADANGHVLADRIVIHAHKNGINNFRAAARDFLYDDMMSRNAMKAKEKLKETIQTQTKKGGVVKAKPTGLRPPSDLNKSYDQLIREGLAEFG